ncbi:response regulator [Cohnella sp. GCM10027633]|uniref:response regulator n=1 Tax=unclassified Cohnella TaxID=2636738 RepID=UPI0036364244
MLRLLIVEDEQPIREGLESLIDWESLGIRVCGTAENGLQALAMLQSEPVDIVLTDIRMPLMDGLQLLEEIRRRGLEIASVLVSGYSDFKYAQSAIRMGVFEFMIKPCSPSDIAGVFGRLATKIGEERRQQVAVQGLQHQLHEHLPLVKVRLLSEWLSAPPLPTDSRVEQMKKLGIGLSPDHVMVIAARIDIRAAEKKTGSPTDLRLIRFAVANVMQETLESALRQPMAFVQEREEIVAICNGIAEWTGPKLEAGVLEVLNNVRQYLGISVTIGISDSKADINLVHEAYREAREALNLRFFRGVGQMYYYRDALDAQQAAADDSQHRMEQRKLEQLIYEHIQSGLYAEALNDAERWLACYQEDGSPNPARVHVQTLSFLDRLLPLANAGDDAVASGLNAEFERLEDKVRAVETIEELSGVLFGTLRRIVELRNPQKQPVRKVQQALDLIAEQYNKPGLSLAEVARSLFVSGNYLSTLFKQELGINFLDFIHQYRIEKAKALLQAGDSKIQTVAREVGYFDEAHFTKTFKKWTGSLPSQYKKEQQARMMKPE